MKEGLLSVLFIAPETAPGLLPSNDAVEEYSTSHPTQIALQSLPELTNSWEYLLSHQPTKSRLIWCIEFGDARSFILEKLGACKLASPVSLFEFQYMKLFKFPFLNSEEIKV